MKRSHPYLVAVSVIALSVALPPPAIAQVGAQILESWSQSADQRTRAETALLYANSLDRLMQIIERDLSVQDNAAIVAAIRSGDLSTLPSLDPELRSLIASLEITARIINTATDPSQLAERIVVLLPEGRMRNSVTRSDVEEAARRAGLKTIGRLQDGQITDRDGFFDLPPELENIPASGVAAYIGFRSGETQTSSGLGSSEFRTLACGAGFFGTGVIERREIARSTTLDGRETVSFGAWEEVSRSCSPEIQETIRFFDACTTTAGVTGTAVFEATQTVRQDPLNPFATQIIIDREGAVRVNGGDCIEGLREGGAQNFLIEGPVHAMREMQLRTATSHADIGNGPNRVPAMINAGGPVSRIPFPAANEADFSFTRSCVQDYGPSALPAGFASSLSFNGTNYINPLNFEGEVNWFRDYNRRETYFSDKRTEYILNYEIVFDPNPYDWAPKGRSVIPTTHGGAPGGDGWYRFSETCERSLVRIEQQERINQSCESRYPEFPVGSFDEAREGLGTYRQIRGQSPSLVPPILWNEWYETSNRCHNIRIDTLPPGTQTVPVIVDGQICQQPQTQERTQRTDTYHGGSTYSHPIISGAWVDAGAPSSCVSPASFGGNDGPDGPDSSFDVTGNGQGDFRSYAEAQAYVSQYGGTVAVVQVDCGACSGPQGGYGEGGGGGFFGGFGGFVDGVADTVGGFVGGVADTVGGFVGGVADTVGGFFGGLFGGGGDSGGDSGSGGPCFLTTAIAEMRGEADDGPTLTKLRAYRDGYMAHSSELKPFIAEYYRIAPEIVRAIPRDHAEWEWIGSRIDLCISLIDQQDYETTFIVYRDMVEQLASRWITEDVHEKF